MEGGKQPPEEKILVKNSRNSHENTFVGVS